MDFAYCGSQFLSHYTLLHDWPFYCLVRLQTAKIRKTIASYLETERYQREII